MSNQLNEATPQKGTLSLNDQKEMIADAIASKSDIDFWAWGNTDLFYLLNYYRPDGASINAYSNFLSELLLLLAKPEINAAFHDEIGEHGLHIIKSLIEFFDGLNGAPDYQIWLDYRRARSSQPLSKEEICSLADTYLSDADKARVIAANEDPLKSTTNFMSNNTTAHAGELRPLAGTHLTEKPVNKIDQYVTLPEDLSDLVTQALVFTGCKEIIPGYCFDPSKKDSLVLYSVFLHRGQASEYYYVHITQFDRLYGCEDIIEVAALITSFRSFLQGSFDKQAAGH